MRVSISLTGQFAAVDEILSGRENLVLVARLRHLKDPATIAEVLLERFSLTDAADLRELKRRNRLLEQENEVLRRAAPYLSQANLKLGGSAK